MEQLKEFQSTLPCGERLKYEVAQLSGGSISIHAPLRGATLRADIKYIRAANFNPRSPAGSDIVQLKGRTTRIKFQSTLPCGERPIFSK
mgnify:FL=1